MSEKSEKEVALHYIKSLVDTARDPFLILNDQFEVIFANDYFLETFKVSKKETEGNSMYLLGNKQWDIPELKKLMEEILPDKKIVKDYKVVHEFPDIGVKTIKLNARQIDSVQLIILCLDDITISENYTQKLESEVAKRTTELADRVKDLEEITKNMIGRELKMAELKKEIARIKKQKNINNGNK